MKDENTMSPRITFETPDLASRYSAAKCRKDLMARLRAGETVILDFRGVESMSDSYADELFGVLSLQLGEDRFRATVQIVNAKDSVLRQAAIAIVRRRSVGADACA